MASPANPDNVVTVKVNYEGVTRRAKMVLRDMVPSMLEDRIRAFLHLPVDAEMILERYSDSAAAYVHLEPGNVPVYKQLYRAAKAKSKLKLRVTLKTHEEKTAPKPVTVEDEPEVPALPGKVLEPKAVQFKDERRATPSQTVSLDLPVRNITVSGQSQTLPRRPHDMLGDGPCLRHDFEDRLASLMERNLDIASDLAEQRLDRRAFLGDETDAKGEAASSPSSHTQGGLGFAVCCNSCKKTMLYAHYHCSTCDDGDFDLCCACVERGVTCKSNEHWLIKRMTLNGQIINSTTETLPPKSKTAAAKRGVPQVAPEITSKKPVSIPSKLTVNPVSAASIPQRLSVTPVPAISLDPFGTRWGNMSEMRTCNCCVQELPEREFLHCSACEDFDLCQACFAKDAHGHHPMHSFAPAVAGTRMPDHIRAKMGPGRNQTHYAICDGCDKSISGVRHKCLDCPDWDYCSNCAPNASFIHPEHRFVAVYEPIPDATQVYPAAQPTHFGICCDGPLCFKGKGYPAYIRGIRYKCAVCNDTDFCANCEASPANDHNKTHPLIKFKTPVRHVSVTTTGEHQDGQRMPPMGDRGSTSSRATETVPAAQANAMNEVQTVVDVKPHEPVAEPVLEPEIREMQIKEEEIEQARAERDDDEQLLQAVFVRDKVLDGTILPSNYPFEQVWVLRNEGKVAWPAGCSVRFVSGDYMGHVDSNHPACVVELGSAGESTVCETPVAPGEEFSFKVPLRTPSRLGRSVSFWRLTAPDGFKFGHRLWCDVNIRAVVPSPTPPLHELEEAEITSQMIFPKLEKESPVASIHVETQSGSSRSEEKAVADEAVDGSVEDEEWDDSDDGFLTDEEYDILDASDEEFLDEQQNKVSQK